VLRKISSDVREAVGDERFRQNRYIFNEYIDGIKEQIIQKIKQNVYEESKKWPNNSFDFYEKYIAKISNEIIKRMK
jgi:hypothetical protein